MAWLGLTSSQKEGLLRILLAADIAIDLVTILAVGLIALGLNTVNGIGLHARKFYIWDESGMPISSHQSLFL
jgi:hypothetical protein